jgi:prepilin-type N-terminal cleavage/methylation domain-containing protein/prepilin-type processing-associated H-X9-DG protein
MTPRPRHRARAPLTSRGGSLTHRARQVGDPPRSRHSGFTLVELVVSLTVLAVLAAMLMPAVGAVVGSARSAQCQANLRQIGIAYQQYMTNSKGIWPAILSTEPPRPVLDRLCEETGLSAAPARPAADWGQPGPHWSVVLWPYIQDLRLYTCPADPKAGRRGAAVLGPGQQHQVALLDAPPESYGLNIILFRTADDVRRKAGCSWGTHGDADYSGMTGCTTLSEQRRQFPSLSQRILFFCGTSGQTVGSQYNFTFRTQVPGLVERWEWHPWPASAAYADEPGRGSNYLFADGRVEFRDELPSPWEWGLDL